MEQDFRIGLHSKSCSCRGGAWAVFGGSVSVPCPGSSDENAAVITMAEWRQLGKPANAEDYEEAKTRLEAGERREFQRYEAKLAVRLGRLFYWKNPTAQAEETTTEVIAKGGALVRSRMVVEKGEALVFEVGSYRTRAEVMYVSATKDGDPMLRLGLRFLDAPMPDSLIPPDARPLS